MLERMPRPRDFDPRVPSPARVYDVYLGGKDNLSADREAAQKVMKAFPEAPTLARANRGFMTRTVEHCANAGITQFIDLGTGIPTHPNVAHTARSIIPDAQVIGVDNDPVVLAHQRAEASYHPGGYTIIDADIRQPWKILADPMLNDTIDLTQPVAVLCVAVLHFIPDTDDPDGIISAFTRAMAFGSFLALSAATFNRSDPTVMARIRNAYTETSAPVIFRSDLHIGAWFDGLDLIPPGLVDVSQWPISHGTETAVRILGGLARKRQM